MNILPLAMIVVLILCVIFILRISRHIISFIISSIILITMVGGAYIAYDQHITNPITLLEYVTKHGSDYIFNRENKAPATKDKNNRTASNTNPETSDIKSQLMDYTAQQSPGPTKNYYWESGQAVIQDTNTQIGTISNSVDDKGRSSLAIGKLTYKMWTDSAGSRQGNPLNPPQGWPRNPKIEIKYSLTNKIYHGYIYNRSHSIADSLAGSKSYMNASNFTTGTRPQNVGANQKGGMRAAEITAEDYWKQHPNSNAYIDYQVLPIYNENETLPRGTIVDIKSSDNAINKRFVIINDIEGYKLNYNTGEYHKDNGE